MAHVTMTTENAPDSGRQQHKRTIISFYDKGHSQCSDDAIMQFGDSLVNEHRGIVGIALDVFIVLKPIHLLLDQFLTGQEHGP